MKIKMMGKFCVDFFRDKKKIKIILTIALISLITGILFCIGDSTLKYVQAEIKGETVINASEISSKDIELDEGKYKLDKNGGKIHINFPQEKYVNKLQYSYISNEFSECSIKVETINGYGDKAFREIKDYILKDMPRSVVNINNKVSSIELNFKESDKECDILIFDFLIDNSFKINPYIFFLPCLLVFTVLIFWVFREVWARKVGLATGTCIFLMGIMLLVIQPLAVNSWDEQVHLYNIYTLGVTKRGEPLPESVEYLIDNVTQLRTPHSVEERLDMMRVLEAKNEVESRVTDQNQFTLNKFAYLFQALVFKVGTAINLPFWIVLFLARATNVILYALTMGFSAFIIPKGKRLLMVISLLPGAMYLSTVLTYDIVTTGFVVLGLCIILRQMLVEKEKFGIWAQFTSLGCMLAGSLSKAVYAPLLFVALFISKDKFESRKKAHLYKLYIVVCCIFLVGMFILPTLLNPSPIGDVRGGDTSIVRQMDYVFGHPVNYGIILIKAISQPLIYFNTWISSFSYLGLSTLSMYSSILVISIALTDSYQEKGSVKTINAKIRLLIIGTAFLVACLIGTAMYLDFTEVGSTSIAGVQGRYYFPMLFSLFLMVQNKAIQNRMKLYNYQFIAVAFSITLLVWPIYSQLFLLFCL